MLCGKCNNKAVGKGRLPPGNAIIRVCEKHKSSVVDFVQD